MGTFCSLKYIIIDTSSFLCSFNIIDYLSFLNNDQYIINFFSLQKNFQYGLDLCSGGLVNIIHTPGAKKVDIRRYRNILGESMNSNAYFLQPIPINKITKIRDYKINRNNYIMAHFFSHLTKPDFDINVISPFLNSHPQHGIFEKMNIFSVPFFYLQIKHDLIDSLTLMELYATILINTLMENNLPISRGASFGFNTTRININSSANLMIAVGMEPLSVIYRYCLSAEKTFDILAEKINKKTSDFSIEFDFAKLKSLIQFIEKSEYRKEIFSLAKKISFRYHMIKNDAVKEEAKTFLKANRALFSKEFA